MESRYEDAGGRVRVAGAEGLKKTQHYPPGPAPQTARLTRWLCACHARFGESMLVWWQGENHLHAGIGHLGLMVH